jgi:hypothetical protein
VLEGILWILSNGARCRICLTNSPHDNLLAATSELGEQVAHRLERILGGLDERGRINWSESFLGVWAAVSVWRKDGFESRKN